MKSIILLANLHCVDLGDVKWGAFHFYLLLGIDLCQKSSAPREAQQN